jgi:hypothetical protein
VVAADAEKEDLLLAALPHIAGTPKVIVAGYGHLAFRDRAFEEEQAQLLVPSLANGYPHSLVHLYQCLANAVRLGLSGTVAEFGMFKGGTTMFLSRVIERLGASWPVIGFDTFGGFAETCRRLEGEDLVLTFTGTDRFRCTLGERIAGHALLGDPRWLHLHGTGVFYRQQAGR